MNFKVVGLAAVLIILLFVGIGYSSLPAAPQPDSFVKYPDYQGVDLYTGDMSLSIPLMTVPGRGGLNFPITVGYSAGIKVHQPASWVGLGWELGVGSITRNINSIPDDYDSQKGENYYYYNKFTADIQYQTKEKRTDWLQTLSSAAISAASSISFSSSTVTTLNGGGYSRIGQQSVSASVGGLASGITPVEYMDYDINQINIPSQPSQLAFDGFMKSYSGASPSSAQVTDVNFNDINYPDSFFISSPLYTGEMIYGNSLTETGQQLQMHFKRGVGNIEDDDSDADCDVNNPQTCTDAVDIKYFKDSNGMIDKFELVNVDGSTYIFTPSVQTALSPSSYNPSVLPTFNRQFVSFSKSTMQPSLDGQCHFNEDYNYAEIFLLKPYVVTWGLKEIRDANFVDVNQNGKADSSDIGNWVKFNYNDTNNDGTEDWSNMFHNSNPRKETGIGCVVNPDGTTTYSETFTQFKTLESIETPTHVAMFYQTRRDDGTSLRTGSPLSYVSQPKLSKIALYNKNVCDASNNDGNAIPKCRETVDTSLLTYVFKYDYTLAVGTPDHPQATGGKLTLKELTECSGNGPASSCREVPLPVPPVEKKPSYIFTYDSGSGMCGGYDYSLPNWNQETFDTWGYYYPLSLVNQYGHKGGTFDDCQYKGSSWSLSVVKWPTGGTTGWNYEPDKYLKVNNWYGPVVTGFERQDTHYGGGIRVSEVVNTDGRGNTYKIKYLYNINDLDFTEDTGIGIPNQYGESSGIANVIPGTYENDQYSLLDGSAYSSPQIGYSKVTVIPGYNSAGATNADKAPYGYTVHEFYTAVDFPLIGTYKPPIVFSDYAGANLKYGFSFSRQADKFIHVPTKTPFILSASKNTAGGNRVIRFLIGKRLNIGTNQREFCIKDVTITPTDQCNLDDSTMSCANVYLDSCTWWDPSENQAAQDWYNWDCDTSAPEGSYKRWCQKMIDWTAIGGQLPQNPQGASPALPAFHVRMSQTSASWPENDGTIQETLYPELGCLDVDPDDNTCDLIQSSLPVNQRYSADKEQISTIGLSKRIKDFSSSGQLVRDSIQSYQLKDSIDPAYHFPKSSWWATTQTQTMVDGITTTTNYEYNLLNGLPNKIIENADSATKRRITNTIYAVVTYPEMLKDEHMWSQPFEVETYDNVESSSTKVSYSKTEWAKGSQFLGNGNQYNWFPWKITSGLGSDQQIVSTFIDYDQFSNLLKVADAKGQITEMLYRDSNDPCNSNNGNVNTDDNGYSHAYPTCIRDNLGYTSTFIYNNLGQTISSKDQNNQEVEYTYDIFSRLMGVERPLDSEGFPSTTYSYYLAEKNGGISLTNPNSVQTTQKIDATTQIITDDHYDGIGRFVQNQIIDTEPQRIISDTTFNAAGLLYSKSKPYYKSHTGGPSKYISPDTTKLQSFVTYWNDPLFRTKDTYPTESSTFIASNPHTTTSYSGDVANGYNVVTLTDEEDKIVVTKSDKFGNLIQLTDPAGGITTTVYDIKGNALQITNPKGDVTYYTYDSLGRLVESNSPDSGISSNTYDANGNVIVKMSGIVKRPRTVNGAQFPCLTCSRIDNPGFEIWTSANPDAWTPVNVNLQVISDTTTWGNAIKVEYVTTGARLAHPYVFEKGKNYIVRFDYKVQSGSNVAINDIRVDESASSTWGAACNSENQLDIDISDATTQWKETKKTFVWNSDCPVGDLLLKTTGNTNNDVFYDNVMIVQGTDEPSIIKYSYDILNRLVQVDYPQGSSTPDLTYYYDETQSTFSNGRLSRIVDTTGKQTKYDYDERGRITAKTETIEGINYVTGYSYDLADNVKIVTYPNQLPNPPIKIEYFYNNKNQLTGLEIDNTAQSLCTYQYNPTGTLSRIDFSNNVDVDFTYTNRDWINTHVISGGSVDWQRDYNYDDVGNVKTILSRTGAGSWNDIHTLQYDNLYRLTEDNLDGEGTWGSSCASSMGTNCYDVRYTYDSIGNRLSEQKKAVNNNIDILSNYGYDAGTSKLTSIITPTGTIYYDYDSRGNIIKKSNSSDSTTFRYNEQNLLTEVDQGNYCESYIYNVGGMRTIKEVSTREGDTGSVKTIYIYGAGGLDPLYEKDVTVDVVATCRADNQFSVEAGKTIYLNHFNNDLVSDDTPTSSPVLSTGITYTPGLAGAAVLIDSNADRLTYSSTSNVDSQKGTIEMWVNPKNWNPKTDTNVHLFFEIRDAVNNRRFTLGRWYDPTYKGYIYFNADSSDAVNCPANQFWEVNTLPVEPATSRSWNQGEWHHIAAVWDFRGPSKLDLYIDGVLANTRSVSGSCPSVALPDMIIGNSWQYTQFMNGAIDELRISNTVKTATEIQDSFKLGSSLVMCSDGTYVNTCAGDGMNGFCNNKKEITFDCRVCNDCTGEFLCGSNGACYRRAPLPSKTQEP